MLNLKIFMLALLLLATDALAARINYSAKYTDGAKISRTFKNAEVADDKEQLILDGMASWSGNRYTATKSRLNIIQVVNAQPAASKGKASEQVQDMQSIVHQHTK